MAAVFAVRPSAAPLAIEFIGDGPGPCPAMEFDEGRFWCGLVRNASKYIPGCKPFADDAIRAVLLPAFGTGCDSDDYT